MKIKMIPLSALVTSPANVRKTGSKATANNERVGWIATRFKPGGADSGMSRCGLSSPYGRWIIDSRTVYGG